MRVTVTVTGLHMNGSTQMVVGAACELGFAVAGGRGRGCLFRCTRRSVRGEEVRSQESVEDGV